jgi:hypothetical protein
MEPNYDIHLGLVVSSSPDPEGRNRVQVWIPYLSNTLYGPLNQKLKDVHFKGPEDLNNIDKDILTTLQTTLPWAECAAPLFGGSSGTFNTTTGQTAVNSGSTIQGNSNAEPSLPTTTPDMRTDAVKPINNKIGNKGNFNSELLQFQKFYADNYSVFDAISQQAKARTGYDIPPSLLASIYARESNAYQNSKVGSSTGNWYRNFAEGNTFAGGSVNTTQFISDAVNSIVKEKGHFNGVDPNNIQSQLNAAERWNGLGYRNKPGGNPYLYNGTPNYTAGLYTQSSDGVDTRKYDPNKIDANPGVALLLSSLNGMNIPSDTNQLRFVDRSAAVGCVPSNVGTPGAPVGTFSIPNGGTKVWVFFMGGDIQRPVYFAQAPNPGDINALRG